MKSQALVQLIRNSCLRKRWSYQIKNEYPTLYQDAVRTIHLVEEANYKYSLFVDGQKAVYGSTEQIYYYFLGLTHD